MVQTKAMPATIEEGEAWLIELLGQINQIEAQLADRDVRDNWGDRVSGVEYHQWRRRAVAARAFKVQEYRELKAWVQRERQRLRDTAVAQRQAGYVASSAAFRGRLEEMIPGMGALVERLGVARGLHTDDLNEALLAATYGVVKSLIERHEITPEGDEADFLDLLRHHLFLRNRAERARKSNATLAASYSAADSEVEL